MRVTHIVAHPPFREGTGTVCYYNVRALRELGCEAVIWAPGIRLQKSDLHLEFYRYLPTWLAIGNAYLTPKILSCEKSDLIHLHFPFIFGSELTLLRSVYSKIPFVVTYHNDLIGGGIRRNAFSVYNRVFTPVILKQARKIIVTSYDYAASSIYAKTIFKQRDADVVEVANGVETELFHPGIQADYIRVRHKLSPNQPVVLFVSSLDRSHARKGLTFLLEALSLLEEAKFKLLVVGDGDMRPVYEAQAESLGLGGQVIFAGRVPQVELPDYYAAGDLVAIPSRPPEAFGLALAQGMATGKAVIGSNIPGVRTLITDGETGFLIEPGDRQTLANRIELLISDSTLRHQMGQLGRHRIVDHYTWRRIGERLLDLYKLYS